MRWLPILVVPALLAGAQPGPRVAGTVEDEKGTTIEGAVVVAVSRYGPFDEPPPAARTDARGRFEIALVGQGPWELETVAEGYAPEQVRLTDPETNVRFVLTRGGAIEGVVLDAHRQKPIPGARVETRASATGRWLAEDPRLGMVEAVTDENGRFRLTGLPATRPVSLSAMAPGYGRATRANVEVDGDPVELSLSPGTGLYGRLVDPDGEPVDGAFVDVGTSQAWGSRGTTPQRSDGDGRFAFFGLEPGTYRLFARHADFALLASEVAVERDRDAEVELVLSPGATIRGRLVDEDGEPVSGKVRLLGLDDGSLGNVFRGFTTAPADEEGHFAIQRVPPGDVTLEAESSGFGASRLEVATGDRPGVYDVGDIVLEVGLAIRGRVLSTEEEPVAGAVVHGFRMDGGLLSRTEARRMEARTDADGGFVLAGLADGVYAVTVRAPGFASAPHVSASPGDRLTLTLEPGGSIRGHVVDESQRPVSRFRVEARSPERRNDVAFGRGAEDGTFLVDDLGAGEYVVVIEAPDHVPETLSDVRVAGGTTTEIGTVRLRRGARVEGVVVDTSGAPVSGAQVVARRPGELRFRAEARAVSSDAFGRFSLEGVPEGVVDLVASHPSFAEARREGLEISAEGPSVEVEIVLRGGGTLEGQVRSRDGGNLGTRSVSVVPAGELPFSRNELVKQIAPDGSFRFEHVPAGKIHVGLLTTSGNLSYATQTETVEIRDGETTYVELQARELLVRGQVRKGGAPLAGAEISFVPAASSSRSYHSGPDGRQPAPAGARYLMAISDEDGLYELLVDVPGEYGVTVSSRAVGLPARTVSVPDMDVVPLDLDFGGASVSGRVVDAATESPLTGILVVARGLDSPDARGAGHQTDGDGAFTLELEPGRYAFSARGTGYGMWEKELRVTESGLSDVTIALSPGLAISGRVRGPGGAGLSNLMIWGVEDGTDPTLAPSRLATARSLADGSFRVEHLAEGRYNVLANGMGAGVGVALSVPAGAEDVALELRPAATVEVLVVDGEDAPVANALVSIAAVGGHALRGLFAPTGPDGRVELVLPAGNLLLKAAKLGESTSEGVTSLTVAEGARVGAKIVLVDVRGERE